MDKIDPEHHGLTCVEIRELLRHLAGHMMMLMMSLSYVVLFTYE